MINEWCSYAGSKNRDDRMKQEESFTGNAKVFGGIRHVPKLGNSGTRFSFGCLEVEDTCESCISIIPRKYSCINFI